MFLDNSSVIWNGFKCKVIKETEREEWYMLQYYCPIQQKEVFVTVNQKEITYFSNEKFVHLPAIAFSNIENNLSPVLVINPIRNYAKVFYGVGFDNDLIPPMYDMLITLPNNIRERTESTIVVSSGNIYHYIVRVLCHNNRVMQYIEALSLSATPYSKEPPTLVLEHAFSSEAILLSNLNKKWK